MSDSEMDIYPPILTNRSLPHAPKQKSLMNIYPPILTNHNRSLPPKQQSPSSQQPQQNQPKLMVCLEIITPSTSFETNSAETNKIDSINTNGSIEKIAADTKTPANNKFYYKFSSKDLAEEEDEDTLSEMSDVENDWSDMECDGGNVSKQRSREAQEAELQNRYDEAMKKLRKQEFERAVATFAKILVHPIMKKYYVPDWKAIDLQHQEGKEGGENGVQNGGGIGSAKMLTNMAKIYFNVNLAMALLVDNCVPFYMQAISICSQSDDLWFNCGSAAFKQGDWRTAKICLSRCAKEFRAMESLLLAHFMDDEFPECFQLLKNIFQLHPEHQIGHVIRQQIAASSPLWAEWEGKTFNRQIVEFQPSEKERNKVLLSIRQFRQRLEQNNKDGVRFNLFKKEFEKTNE